MTSEPTVPRLRSFRDPAGYVAQVGERFIRVVRPSERDLLNAILGSSVLAKEVRRGRLIETTIVPEFDAARLMDLLEERSFGERPTLLEHPRVPFPSLPCEWPAAMLAAAGALTLELSRALLSEGLGLKDATPHNILYRGPNPVFVDLLSVERRRPGDAAWVACAQFVRTFVGPLVLERTRGIPSRHAFSWRRDGLEPRDLSRLLGPGERFLPSNLLLITIPAWLDRRSDLRGERSLYKERTARDPATAEYVLRALFRRLERALRRATPRAAGDRSSWTGYGDSPCSYSSAAFAQKDTAVASFLRDGRPRSVLDVGANTGHFAHLAAAGGARVVAIDSDHQAAGEVWRRARQHSLDVLPLVVDFANPTPSTGWANAEHPSFLERAQGHFDLVIMLAVLHHLVVSDRIPLRLVVDAVAGLTTRAALIEFVPADDLMFRRLARGRDALFRDWTRAAFEGEWNRRFGTVRTVALEGGRELFWFEKQG